MFLTKFALVVGLIVPYAFKRVIRSWKLFAALLLGVVLASTFFAGVNVGADTAAKQALDQQLSQIAVDIVVRPSAYYEQGIPEQTSLLSSDEVAEVVDIINETKDVVDAEVISKIYGAAQLPVNNETFFPSVVGISSGSRVYDGLTVVDGASSLQKNETYVWVNSPNAEDIEIGNVLSFNLSIWDSLRVPPTDKVLTLNLTVVGFVELDNRALSIAAGQYYQYYGGYFGPFGYAQTVVSQGYIYGGDLLIVSWERTFASLMDYFYALSPQQNPLNTEILAFIDRESLISAWDVSGSINRLEALTFQIDNKVRPHSMSANNNLQWALSMHQALVTMMRFTFLAVSLPVFFVAWYMGMTVSDVSFNLRRREIGLLLTKGFSKAQLFRVFLGEALLIGLIAGIAGIVLSLLLNPFFVQAVGGQLGGASVVGSDTIIITVAFSIIITLLSMFTPARKASKLNAVDALREYMYIEEVKPYKRTWPWLAFILGSYKLVILLLGINMFVVISTYRGGNVLVMILLWTAWFLDGLLTPLGPLLFLWGFTKIFIRGSIKFQELITKAAKFLGDLGALATRNVQRNPARAASIAFLIALILGYSFQVVGSLASEQDYVIRDTYFSVGSDIGVALGSVTNASTIMSNITDLAGVSSAALERSFDGESSLGYINIRAVNPEDWLSTAYYESEWFGGSDVATAFQSLASNDTIILERSVAKPLKLSVGDNITVSFGKYVKELRVVGFFGREPPDEEAFVYTPYGYGYSIRDWSYASEGLYHELGENITYASAKIFVKLESGVSGKAVADKIRGLDPNIVWVSSVEEQLQARQDNPMSTGTMSIQRLGVAFAILAASIGTGLVVLVSLKERSREATIMSVRGLSYRQLIVMFLTENLAVVTFAVLLGTFVGLVIVRGTIAAANAGNISLIMRRMVFPIDSLLMLVSCFSLVFASTIIPVIIVARRYVTKLERMVRLG